MNKIVTFLLKSIITYVLLKYLKITYPIIIMNYKNDIKKLSSLINELKELKNRGRSEAETLVIQLVSLFAVVLLGMMSILIKNKIYYDLALILGGLVSALIIITMYEILRITYKEWSVRKKISSHIEKMIERYGK